MPFKSGDATPEQIAAEVEYCWDEERAHLVNVAAKKVQALTFGFLKYCTPYT